MALVTAIHPIQVAAMQDNGVIVLNYGEGSVRPDAIMAVFSKGNAITDPATGEVLGHNESRLGFIRVTGVTGRLSCALPLAPFAIPASVGAIVRPASTADIKAPTSKKRK